MIACLLGWLVVSHVDLTTPAPRTGPRSASSADMAGQCRDGSCFWFSQGCQPGCANCTDKFIPDGNCGTELEPTVTDKRFRTYMNDPEYGDFTRHNPWRSPGHAPVFSPCGLAGGGVTYHPENGAVNTGTGVDQGYDGRGFTATTPAIWTIGTEVEVGWSITANHGGGYSYRVCPKTNTPTEDCFQSHHLSLKGDQSWLLYGAMSDSPGARVAIPALRLSSGTHPEGSQWTRNPIPACAGTSGGVGKGFNCSGLPPQFEPPLPGVYGYGKAECFKALGGQCTPAQRQHVLAAFNFQIVDTLEVPRSLPAGEYVLSFRYDSEQTPQVWANCADVTVVSKAPTAMS